MKIRYLIPICLLFLTSLLLAEGPKFSHKDTFTQQEFESVYQDLRSSVLTSSGTSRCIDMPTFCVDTVNKRVGIGLSDPSYDLDISRAATLGGVTIISAIRNRDNSNTSSHASQLISTGGSSSGDPSTTYAISGVTSWTVGADNSDSDSFKIDSAGTVGASTKFTMTTAGAITIPGTFLTTNNTSSAIRATASANGTNPRIIASNTNGTSGQERVALVGVEGDNGNEEMNMRVGKDSSNNAVALLGGLSFLDLGFSGVSYMRIATSGHVTPRSTTGTQNFGDATLYWNDISYKTLTDRGCLGDFADGVICYDGTKMSDLASFSKIEVHPTKKTVYGTPMLDYATFPKVAYKPASYEFYASSTSKPEIRFYPRDENNEPYYYEVLTSTKGTMRAMSLSGFTAKEKKTAVKKYPADGIEMTAMFSIMMGALKEANEKIQILEAKVTTLEQR